jgi:hypothetical protein
MSTSSSDNYIAPQMLAESSENMLPYIYPLVGNATPRKRRPGHKQVKLACTNCRKARKKCDGERPCKRCFAYEATDECVYIPRMERKRGYKRGPYATTRLKNGKVSVCAFR